ncbi:MAG: hypothetical protein QM703_15785 [Gemmatales bacterium]
MDITTTLEHFTKQFPKIEVLFNRRQTLSNGQPVAVTEAVSIEQLSQCFLPWYQTANGRPVGYDHPVDMIIRALGR